MFPLVVSVQHCVAPEAYEQRLRPSAGNVPQTRPESHDDEQESHSAPRLDSSPPSPPPHAPPASIDATNTAHPTERLVIDPPSAAGAAALLLCLCVLQTEL
jgi:hypothetical protein